MTCIFSPSKKLQLLMLCPFDELMSPRRVLCAATGKRASLQCTCRVARRNPLARAQFSARLHFNSQ
jgi:hypothetical protein